MVSRVFQRTETRNATMRPYITAVGKAAFFFFSVFELFCVVFFVCVFFYTTINNDIFLISS